MRAQSTASISAYGSAGSPPPQSPTPILHQHQQPHPHHAFTSPPMFATAPAGPGAYFAYPFFAGHPMAAPNSGANSASEAEAAMSGLRASYSSPHLPYMFDLAVQRQAQAQAQAQAHAQAQAQLHQQAQNQQQQQQQGLPPPYSYPYSFPPPQAASSSTPLPPPPTVASAPVVAAPIPIPPRSTVSSSPSSPASLSPPTTSVLRRRGLSSRAAEREYDYSTEDQLTYGDYDDDDDDENDTDRAALAFGGSSSRHQRRRRTSSPITNLRQRSPDTDFTDFTEEEPAAPRRPKHKRSVMLMDVETDDSVRFYLYYSPHISI